MTNIKNSFILFTLLFIGCFLAVSCIDNTVDQAEVDESINFQEFQQTLHSVFTEATSRIESSPYITRNTISLSIKEAYKDVLGDQVNMSQFEKASKLAADGNRNELDGLLYVQTETLSETIIRSAKTPVEAVEHFDEFLSDKSISDEDRIELIVGKEFVSFLVTNSQAIDQGLSDNLMARSGDGDQEEEQDTDVEDDDAGWWESWGKCAAATVGGYLSGGLVGCGIGGGVGAAIGGPPGAAAGCAAGAAVGAIGGALKGAVATC